MSGYAKFQVKNNKYTKNRNDIFDPTFNNFANKKEHEAKLKHKFEEKLDTYRKWIAFFRYWP